MTEEECRIEIYNALKELYGKKENEIASGAKIPIAAETERIGTATSEGKTRLVNIRISDSTLKEWKRFCVDYDITLTAAIKRAMSNFIKDAESETVEL